MTPNFTEAQATQLAEQKQPDDFEDLFFPWREKTKPQAYLNKPRSVALFESPVRFRETSVNSKLSPVIIESYSATPGARPAITPRPPYCSSTYTSIAATCPPCEFKDNGCYAQTGYTRVFVMRMDQAAQGLSALDVIKKEVDAIDQSFGGKSIPAGRPLRLHVAGDVSCAEGARLLAGAAERFKSRGGGPIWTYTHRWREIPRENWGIINTFASCERPEELNEAREMGYVGAIVLSQFPSRSPAPFVLRNTMQKVIPCPYETRGLTCVECKLCLNEDRLREKNRAIGFAVHGRSAAAVRYRLKVLNGDLPEFSFTPTR